MRTPRATTLAICGLILAGCAAPDQPDRLVVRIGHVAPTSGPLAVLGKDNENGARMAIDELTAKGITIGGRKVAFELVVEDDAGDPRQSVAAAQRLADAKVNGVVGHLLSGNSIPASMIYRDAGIPQISPSSTNPMYTRQGYKTTFRLVADDVQLADALGRHVAQALSGTGLVVLDDRTAYGRGVADVFQKSVEAAGGKVTNHRSVDVRASDFAAVLHGIEPSSVDVVFYGGMDEQAGLLLRQMKQLGIEAKLVGGDGICTHDLTKFAGGAMADGQVICAEVGGIDPQDPNAVKTMAAFKVAYREKFGADVQIFAPHTYDAVNVMVAAMVQAGSADPARYLPVLAKTTGYKGVSGTIGFDSRGDLQRGAVTLYTYKGGVRTLLRVVH